MRSRITKNLAIFLFCLLGLGYTAHAEILIKPSIGFFRMKHSNDLINSPLQLTTHPLSSPEIQFQNIIANLGIHFQFPAGLFIGATYDLALTQISEYTYVNTYGLGVTAGYMKDGWHGSVSYLFFLSGDLRRELSAQRSEYAPGIPEQNFNLSNGKGALIQIGYVKFIGALMGIGPSLQYRFLQFNRVECASTGHCDQGYETALQQWRQIHDTNDFVLVLDIFFKI